MSLSTTAIKRPIFMTSVVLVSLLVGVLCLFKLGVDQFPDITFPVVVVTVNYQGSSPEEIETLISKPIEEELASTSGLKRLTSTNQEGVGVIVAEFNLGVDIKFAEQQIRDKVAKVRSQLPKDIDDPVVSRVDVDDVPIMIFALAGEMPAGKLYDVADNDIKPLLEQSKDVGAVDIYGGTKREIKVEVDRNKLKAHEVSIQNLADKIAASAQNVPAGKVDIGPKSTVFRTIGEYQSIDKIRDTVVNFFGSDVPVTVGSVATVTDSTEDEKSRSFINGQRAIFLEVHKQSGANTVEVANALQKKVASINQMLKQKPGHLEFKQVRDGAHFIRADVSDVEESIIDGVLLAVFVVFFFLGNFRSTIITGLALPNSLLGSFILMYAMHFTINVMTLLALNLAVGLLIDDAIVVRENIFRRLEEGEDPRMAAENGTKEVTLAVIATTLTVIAVFLPVGFLSGTVGQFFKQFGLTIVFAMTISLFDALTVAPMMSAYLAGLNDPGELTFTQKLAGLMRAKRWTVLMLGLPWLIGMIIAPFSFALSWIAKRFDRFQDWLTGQYKRALGFSLRRPLVVLALAVGCFVLSLIIGRSIKSTFLPNSDNGEFQVSLELAPGTTLDETQRVSEQVLKVVHSHSEIETAALTVGNPDGESNVANIYIALVNYKKRKLLTNELKGILREELKPFAYARPKVGDVDIVGGNQQPFNVNLSGDDLAQLSKIAEDVKAKFAKIPGLVDVDTNYRMGKPEFQVRIDPVRAQRLGVLSVTAGTELRGMMEGLTPAKYRENGREYDIRVRLQPDQRDLQKYFGVTYVPNINNNLVRLRDIADGVLTQGPSKISRQNRSRVVTISGDIAPGGALGNIRAESEQILKAENLPPGVTYSYLGQTEDFMDLIVNMVIACGLAVTFVFLILASLYESFVTPFTIMLALPLAIAGALIALAITHQSMNIFSMIGMIMLLGLVTKNSILLVDYALQLERRGFSRNDALMQAGLKRLRPILMTTVALIAGTLPIALGLSEASRSRMSMGIAIIGGLISSTLLTLVVVPAAFGYIDDFRQWCARVLGDLFLAKSARSNERHASSGSDSGKADGAAQRSSPQIMN